ncbi:hypothetical protein [Aporhodopirellula aestuarii]|uniref:TIGR03986 family CRISPR-associated RAMP protein n=1 Tax=Aporhodopirellula aestuarii TaxID=2950107 RepID=A0ABT0U2E9_9BACT|nr:hypothetical protein [Aporhodopirellula aestuarii]MCM2371068.1 hypothetical protein [Aporhodopirellula aestuarii]
MSEQGKLKKTKKGGFQLERLSKKGKPMSSPVPEPAQWFRPDDVTTEGVDAEYELGPDGNSVVKVTIVGKEPVPPKRSAAPKQKGGRGGGNRPNQNRGGHSTGQRGNGHKKKSRNEMKQAPPSVVERPFHNPYTFLPFGDPTDRRREPTLLTSEEASGDPRYTGTLHLKVTTQRPLMTLNPKPTSGDKDSHRTYAAMTIGNDVIVPATGVRGVLRTLMTIITGGTLGYLNQNSYLCQNRDLPMAVQDGSLTDGHPDADKTKCILARVEEVGTAVKPGRVRIGETKLVLAGDLIKLLGGNQRPDGKGSEQLRNGHAYWIGFDGRGEIEFISPERTDRTPWQVKASGTPVGRDVATADFNRYRDDPDAQRSLHRTDRREWNRLRMLRKREGIFLADESDEAVVTLAPEMWQAYFERHTGDAAKRIQKGDLVWLQLSKDEQFIESIQWARWGREGEQLAELVAKKHAAVLPDHIAVGTRAPDGKVDEITALFGQVNVEQHDKVTSFAGRLRPDNLVFQDGKSKLERNVDLAPMSRPNPGCVAFYRDNDDPKRISQDDGLRGYKVYRVGADGDEPWRWTEQPVFDRDRPADGRTHKLNRTVDLLTAGCIGELQISFRSLSQRELALLMAACHLPWRIGGGKPLGLGLCDVNVVALRDSLGRAMSVEGWTIGAGRIDGWQSDVSEDFSGRMNDYRASQQPIKRLRYPRAAKRTNQGINAGGHIWFTSFAKPRVGRDNTSEPGLETTALERGGKLESRLQKDGIEFDDDSLISGQCLPKFRPDDPMADLLFGYDLQLSHGDLDDLDDFQPGSGPDPKGRGPKNRGPNTNPNRSSRQATKKHRGRR